MKNINIFRSSVLNFIALSILPTNYAQKVIHQPQQIDLQQFDIFPTDELLEKLNVACPSGYNGMHPYPNDCTKFVACARGRVYIKDCAAQTGFNNSRLICDPKYNLQCDWNEEVYQQTPDNATILCPKNTTGYFPFPFDFAKHITCTHGQTWVQNCPHNYKFSTTERSCVSSAVIQNTDYVKYYLPFNDISIYKFLYSCPHYGQFIHIYPFDAAKFINCSNGELTVVSCQPFEIFSVTSQTCLSNDLVSEADTELPYDNENDLQTSDKLVCSLNLFGLYPHPFNNTKYLKCVYGRLYSHSCRAGQVYSLSQRICENETLSFDNLPAIQYEDHEESEIVMRSNDSLTYLSCPSDLCGVFVNPFDCSKYIICIHGAMRIITCSNNGDIYSIRQRDCKPSNTVDQNDHVECINKADNDFSIDDFSHGVICSRTGASKHPHPRDWHKYVQCANGEISLEQCPRNHVFSLTTSECIEETAEME